MYLTEQIIIKQDHELYKYCDTVCYQSKNLYNLANYYVRQEFIFNNNNWLRYEDLDKLLKQTIDYKMLKQECSQQILMKLDKNYKSFFAGLREYNLNPDKFTGKPKLSKYKHKTEGRNIVIMSQNLTVKDNKLMLPILLNENIYNLSTSKRNKYYKNNNLQRSYLKVKHEIINQIQITPCATCYKISVIYKQEPLNDDINIFNTFNIMSIDLGVNNLATCVNNMGLDPFVINGRPLKSINQYYNKELADLQSELMLNHNRYTSNATKKLTLKRNSKIKDYMHKASKYIVDYCLKHNIRTIILGYNKGWKQKVNMGKKNNQKFVDIPYALFKKLLIYKCELHGISLVFTEESYTSKCSFIDNEAMKHHKNYLGYRKYRGLFLSGKISNRTKINADIQGAYNIMRKLFNINYNLDAKDINITPYIVNLEHKTKKVKKQRK